MIVADRKSGWTLPGAITLAVLVSPALLSGCGSAASQASSSAPASVDKRRETIENAGARSAPEKTPASRATPTGTGSEVPAQVLDMFKMDLVRRALVKPDAVRVVSATQIEWPDGSLGCGKPGEMYPQMIVPGYLVVLSAAGHTYPYHSDLRGRFVVCVNGVAAAPVLDQTRGTQPQQ